MSKNNGLDKIVNSVLNRVISQSMSISQLKQDYRELSDRTNGSLSSYEWFKRKLHTILKARNPLNLNNTPDAENLVEVLIQVLKELDSDHQEFIEQVIAHIKLVGCLLPGYDETLGPFQQLDILTSYFKKLQGEQIAYREIWKPLKETKEQWGLHANLLDKICNRLNINTDALIHEKLTRIDFAIGGISGNVITSDNRFGTIDEILAKIEFNLDRTGQEDQPLNFRLAQIEIDSENIKKMFSLCFDNTDNSTGLALFTEEERAEPIFLRIIKVNQWIEAVNHNEARYEQTLDLIYSKVGEIEKNLYITDLDQVSQDLPTRVDHLLEYSLHIRLMLDTLADFEKIAGFPEKQASFMARVSHLPERLQALIDDRKTLQETFESVTDSYEKEVLTCSSLRAELIEKENKIEELQKELVEKLERINLLQKQEIRFHEIYNDLAIKGYLPNAKGTIVEKALAMHDLLMAKREHIQILEPVVDSKHR